MLQPRFTADQFTPTKWDTAKVKADFANKLVALILADFPRSKFTQPLYNRLSQSFSHIAHFDRDGFYAAQFGSLAARAAFLRGLAQYGCYGDPTFTYSDVEKVIRSWLIGSGLIEAAANRVIAAQEAAERAQLALLAAKYPDAVTV